MATRVVTSVVKHPDGSAFHGGVVRFRLTPDTFRASPAETYPEDTITAVADAAGDISVTLVSGTDLVYRVTLPGPNGDQFDIAVPDGSATTLEALRASYAGAPATVDSVEAALIAFYGSPPTGRAPIAVQRNDVTIVTESTHIDFSTRFSASESPAGEANIDLTAALDDLTDVAITSAPADDGEILQSNGTSFVNVPPAPMFVPFLHEPVTQPIWTNMPAAATVFNANTAYYVQLDLANVRQVRLWVDNNVAGATGADIYLRYSTDFSAWIDMTGATVVIDSGGGHDSGWVNLPSGAKVAFVYIQVWGKDGNATADPAFKMITAQFR